MTDVLDIEQAAAQLRSDNEALRERLHVAEETLDAISHGEVDSLVAQTPQGPRVFTLVDAFAPYHAFVEEMSEGAVTLGLDGTVLYCNRSFATLSGTTIEHIVGAPWSRFMPAASAAPFAKLLRNSASRSVAAELDLKAADGTLVQVAISARPLAGPGLIATALGHLIRQARSA